MAGSTLDEEIDMRRYFNDMDFRLTNTSIENVSLTGFGTVYNEDEKHPRRPTSARLDLELRGQSHLAEHRRACQTIARNEIDPSARLPQDNGGHEGRLAALGHRLRPGRAGDHRRLRILTISSGPRAVSLLRKPAAPALPAACRSTSSTPLPMASRSVPTSAGRPSSTPTCTTSTRTADQPLIGFSRGQRPIQHLVAHRRQHRRSRLQP